MATEDDALRVLQNIEKLLKSTTALSGNKQTFSNRAQMSQKDRADKEARKAFKAVAAGAKDTNDALLGLNKSLVTLNQEVGKTTTGFGALNTQMARFMTSLQPIQVPQSEEQSITIDNTALIRTISSWGDQTVKAINNVARILNERPVQAQPVQQTGLLGALFNRRTPQQPAVQQSVPPAIQQNAGPLGQVMGRMVQNFGMASASAGGFGYALSQLWDAAVRVTTDFFQISRVGMGSSQNLVDLYKNAFQAGMSLKEYNEVVKSSMLVASRAGTLENFNRIISAQDKQLAVMGIFGAEARQLQAQLAQNSAAMGISTNDLTKATGAQVRIFDELRKSANMTADEFSKMVATVANSEQAQKELLGLAPRERMARMSQLLQLQTVGTKLGMTAEASMALGKALIDQRKATVKDRFEQAGALLQLGAFTGNGAAGQRAMELNMKGRRRTSSEDKELFALVQQMDRSAQQMYEAGSLGTQNVLDSFDEALGKGSLGELIKQGRGASLAKDSGPMQQEAFGKHVGEFGQWVGKLTTFVDGLKNSVVAPLVAGLGVGLLAIFRGPIAGVFGRMLGGGAQTGAVAAQAAGAGSVMQRLLAPITALRSGLGNLFGSVTGWVKSIGSTFQTTKAAYPGFSGWLMGTVKSVGQVGTGLGTATGSILKGMLNFGKAFGPLAGVIDAAIEVFTGEIAGALNPSGGFFNRVGGIITSFFSAIPNFLIDAASFVFGEKALQPIRNGFDIFVAYMNMAVKDFMAKAVGGVGDLLAKILPDDSKLVAGLRSMRSGLEDSAMENAVAVEKLWGDQSQTLKSISAQNQKSAESQTKTTEVATAKAVAAQSKFNNVMAADQLTRQGIIQDAQALIGSPQVQIPKGVTPATVNTDEAKAPVASERTATADNTELLTVLNSILQVMRENLSAEQRQADGMESLLRSRPSVSFPSSEQVADKLLKRGLA